MLQRSLRVRQAEIVADETEIDPGALGHFKGIGVIHDARIRLPQALRSTAIGEVRAMRNVPTHPDAATSTAAAAINSSNGPTGGQ